MAKAYQNCKIYDLCAVFHSKLQIQDRELMHDLSETELTMSKETLIKCTQNEYFQEEIRLLKKGSQIQRAQSCTH